MSGKKPTTRTKISYAKGNEHQKQIQKNDKVKLIKSLFCTNRPSAFLHKNVNSKMPKEKQIVCEKHTSLQFSTKR